MNGIEEEDDDRLFDVHDAEPLCPRCQQVMPAGASVCAGCGHDQAARNAPVKSFAKRWEAGLPMIMRLRIFFICEAVALVSLLLATLLGQFAAALVSWFVFTAIVAGLAGTFDFVDLSRDSRGRIALTKTWRVCFIPLQPIKFRLGEYDGITSGIDRDADMWDWLILFVLLGVGVIPGVVWWFLAIHPDKFFVALSEGHGAPKSFLYRGTNEARMREMADTIHEVAFAV
jgi:hypothetical protein